jgi:hypothetical protein
MVAQIFISYSHVDSGFADKLTAKLERAGYSTWLDHTDIQAGAHWDDEIVKGLDTSEVFLVILSNKSTISQNVKDEIGYAIDHNKQILPVLLENCEVPFRLRRVQYVDFTALKFEEGFQRVLAIIQSFIPTKKEGHVDPISLAIVGALANLGQQAVKDGYEALKTLIARKFGPDSDLSKAVDGVEKKPDSDGRKGTLQEEIAAARADKDPEVLKLAQALIEKIKEQPGGQTIINQNVTGNGNIFSASGNVTVTNQK